MKAEKLQDGRKGEYREYDDLDERVRKGLEDQGIERLYRHQTEALEAVDSGKNVVISTPTASGKSLVYTIPAVTRALEGKRTLYISPMRALINDQKKSIRSIAGSSGLFPSKVQSYSGQLSRDEKRIVRNSHPMVLLSTIDMVHYSLLPYARKSTWSWLFETLDLIVVDELHEFRGIFGSHVSLVFRRMKRILDHFDSDPSVVCCSATIGNPVEHAEKVTGFSNFRSIEKDYSSSGRRRWTVIDNNSSPHPKAKSIMEELVKDDIQTITFTKARQTSERYAMNMRSSLREEGEDEKAEKVVAYHAALNNDDRRTLENSIKSKEILGIWSTKALELGVDIGSMDAAIIDGYPGSRMQMMQQSGRAGRGMGESNVYLVPGTNSLDQYIAENPDRIFDTPENAIVNPANSEIVPNHLAQANLEKGLSERDEEFFPDFEESLERALDRELLEKQADRYFSKLPDGRPFNIRNISDRTVWLKDSSTGETISSLSYSSAIKDVYPDAIYLHGGKQYKVSEFDKKNDQVYLTPWEKNVSYYTKPLKEKQVEVNEEIERVEFSGVDVFLADVTVHGNVSGYYRKDRSNQEVIETERYGKENYLPFFFRTKAIGIDINGFMSDVDSVMDGLHAAEHAIIGVMPLHVLCDREHDLGGLSTPMHGYTGNPTIFVHEGHEGGVGLVDKAFSMFSKIFSEALETVEGCDCDEGCDGCVYSPSCGNANRHISKSDGISVLKFLKKKV